MSTATQNIVNKAWNFAHVLRDDGLSYMLLERIKTTSDN
jgi:type I restriction enzyme M protein